MRYRADVDGLRAVAVLLVLAAHLRLGLTGGYVGVDIFFVISGYLISRGIVLEMDAGTFALVTFYERRARRILPALFVVLAVTTALAWHYLFASEMIGYARSVEYRLPLPRLLAEEIRCGDAEGMQQAVRRDMEPEPEQAGRMLAADLRGVRYISYFEDLCSPSLMCPVVAAPGVPMLWDQGHLTGAGSIRFAEAIRIRGQLP